MAVVCEAPLYGASGNSESPESKATCSREARRVGGHLSHHGAHAGADFMCGRGEPITPLASVVTRQPAGIRRPG